MKKDTGWAQRNSQGLLMKAVSLYFSKNAQDPLIPREMLKRQLHAEIRAVAL